MRIKFSKKTSKRVKSRLKNKARVRKKISGTADRPRLAVFRSNSHMYAQLIDDVAQKTIVAVSTLKKGDGNHASVSKAKEIGLEIAKKAIDAGIKDVVFDRSGYIYHGKVKSLAEGAREAGLNF